MSEPDRTGYRESPDTSDGPVTETQESDQDGGTPSDDGATLTTDAEAQREDSVMRPGNEPD
jgi:hypothetical protein